jgi:hypothetical protein
MNDASGARFFFGADAQGFISSDGHTTFQLLADAGQIALTAGGATATSNIVLDGSGLRVLTPGTLSFGSSGLQPLGHAVSAEQVASILYNALIPIGAALLVPLLPPQIELLVAAALAATAGVPLPGTISSALQSELTIPPDPTGTKTGFGRAGFLM